MGAAGTVGSQLAELLGQRDFSYAELKLFGPPSAAGEATATLDEPGPELIALESFDQLAGFDFVFLATPSAAGIRAACPGPILIDLSAANRAPTAGLPLVAPGLTLRERLLALRPASAFGIPHPAAQVIAAVLRALGDGAPFVGASVLLSASSWGRAAIAKLFNQSADLLNARLDLGDDPTQIAFNLFLPADADELAGIIAAQVATLAASAPPLALQVARAPVFHGAVVALFLPAAATTPDPAARLREAPGIVLVESGEASGSVDAAGQEAVIAKLATSPAGATLWCAFDAARLAALSAIWVAETLSA